MIITVCDGGFSICRFGSIPDANSIPDPFFLAGTSEEVSLVCRSSCVPDGAEDVSAGWALLRVEGPLDFFMVGVISGISSVLADAGVSIFAVSTYLTDYLLVRDGDLQAACDALRSGGYVVRRDPE